jgi:pimeloyl-ACP methyl ester carboxylesterase
MPSRTTMQAGLLMSQGIIKRSVMDSSEKHAGEMEREPVVARPARMRRWVAYGAALAAAGTYVHFKKRQAEWENPPQGKFIHVNGVRLHYSERGSGRPLVLLHGVMGQDFCISGLVDQAAAHYRVIVFDRPGYGFSERPRGVLWGPQTQAKLIHDALEQIGVSQAIIVGHSWGALVAMAMALDFPESVSGLVLASGLYYPTLRLEVPFAAQRLVPVIGDIMRHTTTPIMIRTLWPLLIKRMFHPNEVPPHFKNFSAWMAARPLQIRASAEELSFAVPSLFRLRKRYRQLDVPLIILAGSEDRAAYVSKHALRLHRELPDSELRILPGAGHMVHHVQPQHVLEAVEAVDAVARKSDASLLHTQHAQRMQALPS